MKGVSEKGIEPRGGSKTTVGKIDPEDDELSDKVDIERLERSLGASEVLLCDLDTEMGDSALKVNS